MLVYITHLLFFFLCFSIVPAADQADTESCYDKLKSSGAQLQCYFDELDKSGQIIEKIREIPLGSIAIRTDDFIFSKTNFTHLTDGFTSSNRVEIIFDTYSMRLGIRSYIIKLNEAALITEGQPQSYYAIGLDCLPHTPEMTDLFNDYIQLLTDLSNDFRSVFTQTLDGGGSMANVLNQLMYDGIYTKACTFLIDETEKKDFNLEGREVTLLKELVEFHDHNEDPLYQVAPEIMGFCFTKAEKISNQLFTLYVGFATTTSYLEILVKCVKNTRNKKPL